MPGVVGCAPEFGQCNKMAVLWVILHLMLVLSDGIASGEEAKGDGENSRESRWYTTPAYNTWDPLGCASWDDFQCYDGRCIPRSWVCDGLRGCSQGEDEYLQYCSYALATGQPWTQPSQTTDWGWWETTTPGANETNATCNFDHGDCGYSNVNGSSSVQWIRRSGSTPSSSTGPSGDHTTGHGYYMYIETSNGYTGDVARLISPTVHDNDWYCLQFAYHMYGTDIRELRVMVGSNLVWSRSYNQGSRWHLASVQVYIRNDQVMFEGVRGSGFRGDIAIDDVVLNPGACPTDVETTTEEPTPGWWEQTTNYWWGASATPDAVPCGGHFYQSSGVFESPHYPNNYFNNANCQWTIIGSHGTRVGITVERYNLESCCDHLNIYDGRFTSSPRLARLSGTGSSTYYYSSSNEVLIHFTSDGSIVRTGFRIIFGEINGTNTQEPTTAWNDWWTPGYQTDYYHNFQVRLRGGDGYSYGRVEVYYNGQWGTVCSDNFSRQEARVVCRELGFSDYDNYYHNAYFGQGSGPIWMDDLGCSGYESSLQYCPHNGWGNHNCGHHEDVAVRCWQYTTPAPYAGTDNYWRTEEPTTAPDTWWWTTAWNNWWTGNIDLYYYFQVRLRGNGSDYNSYGRVEVYYNGQWGTVCDDNFGWQEARVVCRELGFSDYSSYHHSAFFGQGSGPIWMDNLYCTGYESSLQYCSHNGWGSHNCGHHEDVSVVCAINSTASAPLWWTTDYWNGTGSCSSAGCGGNAGGCYCDAACVSARDCCYDYVEVCGGANNTYLPTTTPPWYTSQPGPVQVDVLLVNGNGYNTGLVLVFYNGQWGSICDDGFDMADADVICRQLGFTGAEAFYEEAYFNEGHGPIWLDELACNGDESNLAECAHQGWGIHNCLHKEDVGLECADFQIRLADGDFDHGRLEVYHAGQWGTVCDDKFGLVEANVACRQLGFTGALASQPTAYYGQGTGPIWMDDVNCVGNETSLHQCDIREWGSHNCDHSEDIGVICDALYVTPQLVTTTPPPTTLFPPNGIITFSSFSVRLVHGGPNYGRIEVFVNGTWGSVCDDYFGANEARVVCQELGFVDYISWSGGAHYGQGTGPIWMDDVSCTGKEPSLQFCQHRGWGVENCGHHEDVGVECQGPDRTLIACDFDVNTCNFTSDSSADFLWRRRTGRTPSSETGPSFDHTSGNGYYLYIEASSPRQRGDIARLWSPVFDAYGTHCLQFAYHVYGDSIGALRVLVGNDLVFMRNTSQGNMWHDTKIDVTMNQDQIIFEGEVGIGWRGDVAIDDVLLYSGSCQSNAATEAPTIPVPATTIPTVINLADYDIRLADGGYSYGRVEVRVNGEWGTICDDGTGANEARVICRELGFPDYETFHYGAFYGEGTGKIWLSDLKCTGDESSVRSCNHADWGANSCTHAQDFSVVCKQEIEVRFANGGTDSGRVEVKYDGIWGTVCDDGFGAAEARVICRQLGFPDTFQYGAFYGPGDGPIWLNNLQCTGFETNVEQCTHDGWGTHGGCTHPHDISVVCQGSVATGASVDCDFEQDMCGYYNYKFTRNQGPTTFNLTGPDADHTTGSGYYMYTESAELFPGDASFLLSPVVSPLAPARTCLQFAYHMYGADMGDLKVYVQNGTSAWYQPFGRSGDQGDVW
ncbi:scavenger receptor cysteine-rich type 1 protein M130-like isoform X2 [Branchiostoma floridae x Branchiostoma belcheri]